MQNEFKNVVQQVLISNSYDIFPRPHPQDAKHSKQYTTGKVKALLDQKLGAWMHKYKNVSDVVIHVVTQH